MQFDYQLNGSLIAGIHILTIDELENEFGYNAIRLEMISGLKMAIHDLKKCGCPKIYVDGSFTTRKIVPGDYDACWDHQGVNLAFLKAAYPLFFDFANGRAKQKVYYKGELFPAYGTAKENPTVQYIDFFQKDRDGKPKGIVQINLI
jgi:hypothetical protein